MVAYKIQKKRDLNKLKDAIKYARRVMKLVDYKNYKEQISIQKKEIMQNYKILKNETKNNFIEKKSMLKIELRGAKDEKIRMKRIGSSQQYKTSQRRIKKIKQLIQSTRTYYENKVFGDGKKRSLKWKFLKLGFISSVLFLFIMFILPFLLMLNASFKSILDTIIGKVYELPQQATVENYNNAANAMQFWSSLTWSLIITIASNFFIIVLSSMAAWMLVRTKKWYSKAIYYTFLVSMILPFQAIMLPLMREMGKLSLINVPGLIIMYVGFGTSLSVFLIFGFLKSIPTSLEEAALVSGLGPIRIFIKIVLPLMKPIFVTVVILNTMWIWNDFLLPVLVLGAGTKQTLPIALYTRGIGAFGVNINMLMAGLTIIIAPATLFFVFAQKHIIAGIASGSVK